MSEPQQKTECTEFNYREEMRGFPSLPSGFEPTTYEIIIWSLEHLKKYLPQENDRFSGEIEGLKSLIKILVKRTLSQSNKNTLEEAVERIEKYVKEENYWDEQSKDRFNKGALSARNKMKDQVLSTLQELKGNK